MRHPQPTRVRLALGAILTVALATAGQAAAEPVVLQVDGDRAYVDLGAADGVGAGSELELVREIVARDPATGQTLRDRFALGVLTVVKAGEHVCIATPGKALAGRVKVGDRIRPRSPERAFADPWALAVAASHQAPAAPDPVRPGPGVDRAAMVRAIAEAEAVSAAWRETLGTPPDDRIARWRAFLAERPATPYAQAIRTEIASLEAQARALDEARTAATATEPVVDRRRALAVALAELEGHMAPLWPSVPSRVSPGQPIAVAFTARDAIDGAAWLYVRSGSDGPFRRIPLARDGDAYLRATIPPELVEGDAVEWFVEVGEGEAGVGNRATPRSITVDADPSEPPPAPDRSQVHVAVDYVDFDGKLADGYDQYYQAEADFTYRFLHPVHAVRIGFGSLSGKGGPKDVIDADPADSCVDADGFYRCQAVDFTYVYTEFELRPSSMIAVMIRPQAGLLTTDRAPDSSSDTRCRNAEDITDCDFRTKLGLRGRVRFGAEERTNLVVSAGFTAGIGTLFEAAYNWAPRPVVPIHLAVQVTDQPVIEDFGVRLLADVGWRGVPWFYPSVRLSYQARDIDHAGFSGGIGFNFDW